MTRLDLRCKDLIAALDPATGKLHFEWAGKKLPWQMDLGAGSVMSRRRAAGASEETHPLQLAALTCRRMGPSRLQWIGEIAGAGIALNVDLDGEGLAVALSPIGTGDAEVLAAEFPGILRFDAPERETAWSDYHQGALFRADGKPWSVTLEYRHTAMRLFGFTAAGASLAVIVETPFDIEVKVEDDGTRSMGADLKFAPSLGTLAYTRRVRFVPLAEAGHVAIANAFRAYAQRHGLWKSFEERVEENPEVEKLRGAFVACAGYYWDETADQVAAMKAMRRMGFTRGWLFSPKCFSFGDDWNTLNVEHNRMTDAQLAEIQSLGYLCAPFLQVEEAGPSIGMEKFATDAKGEKIVRWQIGECKYWEIAKWRVPAMLAQLDAELVEAKGIHFDTLTAMPLVENWDKSGEHKGVHFDTLTAAALAEHSGERTYDAGGDARLRMDIADY